MHCAAMCSKVPGKRDWALAMSPARCAKGQVPTTTYLYVNLRVVSTFLKGCLKKINKGHVTETTS